MHAPVLVTAPAETPVSVVEAKMHCRVDHDDEDGLFTILVAAATSMLDGYTGTLGRAIVTQSWRQDFDCWSKHLRLPLPAATIASIKVRNSAGELSTVSSGEYALLDDALGSFVRFKDDYAYPSDLVEVRGILVEFTAGYGLAAAVPAAIKQAMLLLIGHWYQNREAVSVGNLGKLPLAAESLLAPYRRYA